MMFQVNFILRRFTECGIGEIDHSDVDRRERAARTNLKVEKKPLKICWKKWFSWYHVWS